MFDLRDAAGVMMELDRMPQGVWRPLHPPRRRSIPVHGWESVRLSFIVNRPKEEPGFRLERQEVAGRNIRYTTQSYAADRPEGRRYG